MSERKAWFLDRDGTIIVDQHFLKDPERIVLLDGAAEALREAQGLGYLLIVVTNQSGIARGYFTEQEADLVDAQLKTLLERVGVHLTKTYRCPHLPEGNPPYNIICECRKPGVGLFRQAIEEFDLNPVRCIACGDKERDVMRLPELGVPAGNLGIITSRDDPGCYPDLPAFFHSVAKRCAGF